MHFQPTPIARLIENGRTLPPAVHHVATVPARRARLGDLNAYLHCSIIGTCLTTSELRKLVPRYKELDRERATDLEIHHAAVELAGEGGEGCKALCKALDARHETTLKRFRAAHTAAELRELWQTGLASAEIPGAYWALMTHPATTQELRSAAFGEVHMLSHLVGAANRADIRRLLALERENGELKCKVGRAQQRLQDMSTRHQLELRERTAPAPCAAPGGETQPAASEELQAALAAKDRALAHQTRRRELAEQELERQLDAARAANGRLEHALALAAALEAEVGAMESTLLGRFEASVAADASGDYLRGKRVIYVGGRPASNRAIMSLVASAGGELTVHDGGIEDRKGLLAAALPTADLVVFPVDCVDHDSMSRLKRVCERHNVPFHPLRSASVASFSALVAKLALTPAAPARVPHFCLRHG